MKKNVGLMIMAVMVAAACTPNVNNQDAEFVQTEEFAQQNLPFSEAVIYGNLIYLSGQIGDKDGKLVEGGIVAETNQAMQNIKAVLERNGSSLDQVIKCTCMLADIAEWAPMSQAYIHYFPNHKPARSSFAATGLAMGARVEIECMAYTGRK
jgi:2-iminobutanoate/2-iminopropanoate deaminase